MSKEISKDWRKELANNIRIVGNDLFVNADRLADQPDYMTAFDITIYFGDGKCPEYEVTHRHFSIPKESAL